MYVHKSELAPVWPFLSIKVAKGSQERWSHAYMCHLGGDLKDMQFALVSTVSGRSAYVCAIPAITYIEYKITSCGLAGAI